MKQPVEPGVLAFPFMQGRNLLVQTAQRKSKYVKLAYMHKEQRWLVYTEGSGVDLQTARGLVCFVEDWVEGYRPSLIVVKSVVAKGAACIGCGIIVPDAIVSVSYAANELPAEYLPEFLRIEK